MASEGEADSTTSEMTALDDAESKVLDPDLRKSIKASDLDDFYSWCEDEGRQMSEEQKTSLVRFTLRWKARMNKFNTDAMSWGWERWRNIVLYEQNEERNEWMKRLRGIADRCLEKAPKDRTEGDVRKIREYLKSVATKNSKVLKLSAEEINILATTVHVVDYKKGDILFLQGQSGDFYYVVVSGTLDLFVEQNHAIVAENLEDHASRNFESGVPDNYNMRDFGTRRVTFYPGIGFGELAIELDEDGYANEMGRSATVLFKERGRLLLVDRETYARTFMKYNGDLKEINDIKNFLQNQQMFLNWGIAQLAQLASVVKRRTYVAGQVVKVQGNRVDEVFFVEHGSLDIVRTVVVPNKQKGADLPTTKEATAAGSATIARSVVARQLGSAASPKALRPPSNTLSIMVAQCGPGSIIGDTELVRGHESFLETAVVPEHTATHVTILCLKRKIFDRVVLKSKQSWGTLDMLTQAVRSKCEWRKQRLEVELGKLKKSEGLRIRTQVSRRSVGIVDRMAGTEIGAGIAVTLPLSPSSLPAALSSPTSPLRRRRGGTAHQSSLGAQGTMSPTATQDFGTTAGNSESVDFSDSLSKGIEAHRRANSLRSIAGDSGGGGGSDFFPGGFMKGSDDVSVMSGGTRTVGGVGVTVAAGAGMGAASSATTTTSLTRRPLDIAEVRDPAQADSDVLAGVTSAEYAGFGVSPTVKGALGGRSKTLTHSQRFFQSQLRLPLGGLQTDTGGATRLLGFNSPSFSTSTPMPANSPRKSKSMPSLDAQTPKKDATTSSAFKQPAPTLESALRGLQAMQGHHEPVVGRGTKSAFGRADPTAMNEHRWSASRGGPADPDPLRATTATILDKDGRPAIDRVQDDPTLAYDFESAAARFDREARETVARLAASAAVTAPPENGSSYVWNPYALHTLHGPGVLRWAPKAVGSREGTRLAPRRSPLPRSPPIAD